MLFPKSYLPFKNKQLTTIKEAKPQNSKIQKIFKVSLSNLFLSAHYISGPRQVIVRKDKDTNGIVTWLFGKGSRTRQWLL